MPSPDAPFEQRPEATDAARDVWHTLVFVTAYYDWPLEGLAASRTGTLGYFACDYETGQCHIYPLTDDELERELAAKELFETHVGTYWSYDRPDDQRHIHNPEGWDHYSAAAAERWPDVNFYVERAQYLSRPPVAVLETTAA